MLPTNGAMSLYAIQQEFGGAASPVPLGDYYRGGAHVNSITLPGSGSFQGAPLASASPIAIPTSGDIQFSEFYGTQSLIVGSGILVNAISGADDSANWYQDVSVPAGVDLVRLYLVGAGGGGGGGDGSYQGGPGGGGSSLSGTFSTAWAGSIAVPRTLRFYIGKGGSPGAHTDANTVSWPPPRGGQGYSMNTIVLTGGGWSTWMNTYAVTEDQAGGIYVTANLITMRWINFPNSGTYTFQFEADNSLQIRVDDSFIADTSGINDSSYSDVTSYALSSPLTKTITLSSGFHCVQFYHTNLGSWSGYGCRIVNDTTSSELWNTRDVGTWNYDIPCGGSGGVPGNHGSSGQGGGGGSGTFVTIINGYGTEYFFAMAGGGGGGGGAGSAGYITNPYGGGKQNGNWMTQGYSDTTAYIIAAPGGEGECPNHAYNGTWGITNDGGGGGGGGGGALNARAYITDSTHTWPHSGLGGRYSSFTYDCSSDGGESGKSAITSSTTKYADFIHAPTTAQSPILPTSPSAVSTAASTLGLGGNGSTSATLGSYASPGTDGFAYVDWGYTTSAVSAPAVTRSAIYAGIIPYTYGSNSGSWDYLSGTGTNVFLLNAFGGGGNPGSEYTYTWVNISGSAGISGGSTYSATITGIDTDGAAGEVQVTVSDGTNSATAAFYWSCTADAGTGGYTPPDPLDTCFPAGAMVTLPDGTTTPIETIKIGDFVMGPTGPTKVLRLGKPLLGSRKLLAFADGHRWTEDHAHWTKAADNTQWWWNYNPEMWLSKVTKGTFGGLADNSTMRTGTGYQYAHVDGWKTNTVLEADSSPDMQMYLPLTNGTPIIVDGYLVGAGIDQAGYDYTKLNWDSGICNRTVADKRDEFDEVDIVPEGLLPPPGPNLKPEQLSLLLAMDSLQKSVK